MQLHNLTSQVKRKKPKRLGRGRSSGKGKTSTRGHKGEKSRKGKLFFVGFAGGNLPYFRRIPKRGFTHKKRIEYQAVNLEEINEKFKEKEVVDLEGLLSKNLIKKKGPIKVLGKGKIEKSLKIYAHKFSKRAKEKIEKVGGKIECLTL